jgi:hypothetical protein
MNMREEEEWNEAVIIPWFGMAFGMAGVGYGVRFGRRIYIA